MSDWKWTGPAEPMLVLTQALRARGHRVDLICPRPPPDANRSLWQEAKRRGIEPVRALAPRRGAVRPGDGRRVARLRGWLETQGLGGPYETVHCWHSRDHVLAARALGLSGPRVHADRPRRASLVRTLSRSGRISRWPWNRWLFGPGCDGLICPDEATRRGNRELRGARPFEASLGAIDLDALQPHRDAASVRRELGLSGDEFLIGVVARMQAHRRFDLLLAALAAIVRERPEMRLVLIGRGTRVEEVVRRPARAMGLESKVVFAGYRTEDYADVVAAMDCFTFLVPGSDGTCRALRQAAALGLPLVGTRRGAIPEIVADGENGWLVSESPEAIAAAWARLRVDPQRRRAMGAFGREQARARFDPARHAEWMEGIYASLWASRADAAPGIQAGRLSSAPTSSR